MTARSDPTTAPTFRARARGRVGARVTEAPLTVIVTVVNSTLQRWTFNRPILNNPALLSPSNYATSPSVRMLSVAVGPGAAPIYVDVTTSEMENNTSYTPTVHRVEAV